MDRLFSRPLFGAILVALVSLIVYLTTLAPSVDFIDSGELATVCTTLGIAHPTGYPLFTMVGWVFSHLPIASTVIGRLNVMAAFFTALGAGVAVLLAHEIISHWLSPKRREAQPPRSKRKQPEQDAVLTPRDPSLTWLAAIGSGLAVAFSATWWAQSTGIEVYPLHLFLVPVVLVFFLRMLRLEEGRKIGRDGLLFALMLGLSFANHMTTVLLAPAALYLYFARYRFSSESWRRILGLSMPFLAGLLVYLYLPIRSSQYPLMDWGHPATANLFFKHITGGQYKIWMFSSAGAAAKNWSYFWHRAPKEFSILGGLLAVAGMYEMARAGSVRGVRVLIASLLLFFGCLLYAINYDIHDIDSYFLLAYLAVALWIGAGLLTVAEFVREPKQRLMAVSALAALLVILEVGLNYSEVDESGNYMVEDYTRNMLTNLPPNAIIFSAQWDFWVSGAFYYQLVEKLRPDVLVIDKAMLRDRPWYYSHLQQRAPQVFAKSEPEMSEFLRYLRAFDRGEPFDQAAIAPAYSRFTEALIERNLDRPIFVAQDVLEERDELFAPRMKPVPAGIAYRMLLRADTLVPASPPVIQWRDTKYRRRNYYTENARLLQAAPLAVYAQSLLQRGDKVGAKGFLDAALRFKPDLSADLSGLSEREQSLAESNNEQFARIEALRKQLDQP